MSEKPETADDMWDAIDAIIDRRMIDAANSEYDRKVCVTAVGAARQMFDTVPVKGTATDFAHAVILALTALQESYNDPDGEYTSGKSSIGSVVQDVWRLVEG